MFADLFAVHPHLLDAALGRTLAYFSTALVLGLRFWAQVGGPVPHGLRRYGLLALAMGLVGAFLVLHASLDESLDPFAVDDSSQASGALDGYGRLILQTRFGQAWLAFATCLAVGVAGCRHALPSWLGGLGLCAALVASSHAGERGITLLFGIDLLHLALALFWLGGLALLVWCHLGGACEAGAALRQRFSTLALPVFMSTVATGLLRTGVQLWNEGGMTLPYLAVLAMKLAAVAGVMIAASRLRRLLAAGADARTRDGLSLEAFFAALVLFLTGLLTQLPPV